MNDWTSLPKAAAACRPLGYPREHWTMRMDYAPPPKNGGDFEVDPNPSRRPQDSRSTLDQMASLLCGLAYGEMIELAAGIWQASASFEKTSGAVTQANLPAVLHQWALERRK